MNKLSKIIEKLDKLSTNLETQTDMATEPAKANSGAEIVTTLIKGQQQLRIFHWQTTSYSQHKTFGGAYESLDEKIDELLETYFGKYGRIQADNSFDFSLSNLSSDSGTSLIDSLIEFLSNRFPSLIDAKDTDLLNIRDEIVGELNRTKYLLTLS